jgi:methoxymalonate biosynthesis acyl carrier protein
MTEQTVDTPAGSAGRPSFDLVVKDLTALLETRTKTTIDPEQSLFSAGVVNSMFAMELVVTLEEMYDIEIVGSDLRMENFDTVKRMAELVLRLATE